MTVRPRYPFVGLGVPLVLILLFAYGPMVILLIGGMVAGALGCAMPINGGAAGPCLFMGVDLAKFLALAVLCGYLNFLTFPTGTTLLGIWLVAAAIVTLVWGLRRWRVNANG
jgi:hypothetical protein